MENALWCMEPGRKVDLIDITKREFVNSLDIVWISMFNYSEIEKQTDCLKHQDHGVSTFKPTGCIWWKLNNQWVDYKET